MKPLFFIVTATVFMLSCNQKNVESENTSSYDVSGLTILDSSFNDFHIAFDKNIGQVGLIVHENQGVQYYPLGLFHNTENNLPTKINVDTLCPNVYLFTVISHLKTGNLIGNNINLVSFNVQTKNITQIHAFNNLGAFADTLAYDTLKNIKFFDYKFIKVNQKDSFLFDIQEYKPFKPIDQNLSKKSKYVTAIQQHPFHLKGL